MNEQTKKLAEQAGCYHEQDKDGTKFLAMPESAWERFAELIRDDERDKCARDYLQDCSDAIDAERKACAEHYLSIMRDAVESAILKERDKFWDALMSDLENGVKSLNEKASEKFAKEYPALNREFKQE